MQNNTLVIGRKLVKKLLLTILFMFTGSVNAEINLISFQFGQENPSTIPTVYYTNAGSKALVIFLPGGSGSFGVTKKPDPKPNWLLAALHKSIDPPLDLVFMDSHYSLQADFGDSYSRWSARREMQHLEQIRTVVNFYQKKTGKPIFLLGHSNGSLSIAEFLNQSPDNQKLVAGVVFSGSRNETLVRQNLSLPVLILHHKSDPNRWTTPSSADQLFASIKQNNSANTWLSWVEGGKDVPWGDPAHSGRHMYNEALDEAARLIENFINRVIRK
jgi:pimeloyl-ACP methyl ester carboxylesterase